MCNFLGLTKQLWIFFVSRNWVYAYLQEIGKRGNHDNRTDIVLWLRICHHHYNKYIQPTFGRVFFKEKACLQYTSHNLGLSRWKQKKDYLKNSFWPVKKQKHTHTHTNTINWLQFFNKVCNASSNIAGQRYSLRINERRKSICSWNISPQMLLACLLDCWEKTNLAAAAASNYSLSFFLSVLMTIFTHCQLEEDR